jgi:carbon-monoxide dehydrogenase medium subunit
MYSFNYQRATSVEQARERLQAQPGARLLAGGQSLVASMKLRLTDPAELVDLGGIASLAGIRVEGRTVTIGAMTRHAEVAASAELQRALPSLAALAGGIADRMVRNMGTLGGSVANNDPAADYPSAVLALDATVITDRRRIAADAFFLGMFQTALEADELITAIEFKVPRRAAYVKYRHPASRYAIVGVYVADFGSGVRVAVTGAGPGVFRIPEMERALGGKFAPASVAGIQIPSEGLNADIHAGAEYRAEMVTVMATRAVERVLSEPASW